MNHKLLSIIIPCFGKTKEIVSKTIESAILAKKKNELVEIVFIYKNLDEFNYDWANSVEGIDKVIKVNDTSLYKNAKISMALEQTTGSFILILDSDDLLIWDNIDLFINELSTKEQKKDMLLITNYMRKIESSGQIIECNDSDKYTNGNKKIVLANFNYIFSKSVGKKIKDDLYKANYQILNEDLFLSLLCFENIPNLSIDTLKTKILCYIKYIENNSSLEYLVANKQKIDSSNFFITLMEKKFEVNPIYKQIFSETYRRLLLSCWFEKRVLKIKGKISLNEINKFYKKQLLFSTKLKIFMIVKIPVLKRFILRTYVRSFAKKGKNKNEQ